MTKVSMTDTWMARPAYEVDMDYALTPSVTCPPDGELERINAAADTGLQAIGKLLATLVDKGALTLGEAAEIAGTGRWVISHVNPKQETIYDR
jgi:hypothetical protein